MPDLKNVAVTFVIPVRHPDSAPDWGALTANLATTARSISNQNSSNWRAVVVANTHAKLPDLPAGFDIVRVDLPANPIYEKGTAEIHQVWAAVRRDKGARILAGMLASPTTDYFMVVDDDDFVSRDLVSFVEGRTGANGWVMNDGYVWTEGGRLLYKHPDFNHFCGTSLIIRRDLWDLPDTAESADPEKVSDMLGSHVQIAAVLASQGTPLAPLPYPGAVYRVGHRGSHSQSVSMASRFLVNKQLLSHPAAMLRNWARVSPITAKRRREFGL